MTGLLQYATWTTEIDLGFYSALAKSKIDHDRLDSSARKLLGLYQIRPRDDPARSTCMQIHSNALTNNEYTITDREFLHFVLIRCSISPGICRAEGMIRNFNTLEEYKDYDRTAHMERAGRMVRLKFR